MDFANSVINAAAGQAAIWHDLRGVNSTLSGGEASGLMAIAYAADLIRSGRADALLAGGVEELCFESFVGCFRAGRLCGAANGAGGEYPIPFDARRNGFALAEGAALLLLEDAESAAARGAPVLAELRGHGAAFEGGREEPGAAVARAIGSALADARLAPEQIDFASLSANGSVAGDRAEALGVAAAFGARSAELPVAAVKGLLGEALGASGALQAVALLGTFGDGVLPGIPALERTDDGFPLGGLATASRRVPAALGLANARGWDGHCSAVLFGGAEG
jgi:3-oxoacyl-(acyl-carrier-protein) synthase